MAAVTLERLAEGIRRANAVGDVETVKKLGLAYRQLQSAGTQQPAPAPDIPTGAQLRGKVADLPSKRPTLGDEAMSFGRGVIEGIPIAGPMLSDWRRGLDANIASAFQNRPADEIKAEYAAADEALRSKTGGARTAGNITGAVASLAPLGATSLGGRLLGTTGSLGQRVVAGAGSGALISGADTAARGGSPDDIFRNTVIGAGLGTVFPLAGAAVNKLGQKAAQTAATTAAIKNAPAAADLKSAASALFQQVDQAGVTVEPRAFGQFVVDLAKKARADRINPKLDPKAYAAFEELGGLMGEVLNGSPLTLSELHNMRQIAQRAAVSSEGRDAMFANRIVDALDDFITKPGATTTPNGPATGNMMLDAISTWARARRVGLVEEAISKAQNTASGFENGLRIELRKLLNNKRTANLFNAAERAEMEKVVRGTVGSNLMKLLGKFGFGTGPAGNMLGGTIGFGAGSVFGGPIGGMVAAGIGTGARKASEKLTERAAERAAKVVATPNVPVLAPRALAPGIVPPAALPLTATRDASAPKPVGPAAARVFFDTLMGSKAPITERTFKPDELAALSRAVAKAEAAGRNYITYGDYDPSLDVETSGNGMPGPKILGDPLNVDKSMAGTIGRAKFKRLPDGSVEILDTYDFENMSGFQMRDGKLTSVPDTYNGDILQMFTDTLRKDGMYGALRILGENAAAAEKGRGRPVRIKVPVQSLN